MKARHYALAGLLLGLLPVPDTGQAASPGTALRMPEFQFDTQWLKLPANLATGEIVAVAVDRKDHLWVLHRPRSVRGLKPANVAPPVMEFDAAGRYLRGFGGPGPGYEWPDVEHSLAVTASGHIWVGGNFRNAEGRGDDMLLKFDRAGRFVRQIGRKGASSGNYDPANLRAPGDVFIDDRRGEILIADGYGNQRVAVFDEHNGAFRRMWGAFGAPPPNRTPPTLSESMAVPTLAQEPTSFSGLHGVEIARDGRVYVSDRANRRIQVFTRSGKFLQQVAINRDLPSPLTASGITFSHDRAQAYLFVADFGNGLITVLDRKRLAVIGRIGRTGVGPGEFKGPHLIDSDSKGAVYVAEVSGRRLQKLTPIRQKLHKRR